MAFTSIEFLIFITVVMGIYLFIPGRVKNIWIFFSSCFFYGYWSTRFLALLLAMILIDYIAAIQIQKNTKENTRKYILQCSLILNLGVLFLFKYFNFFSSTIATLSGTNPYILNIAFPLGISFYTFHAISYLVDVYRNKIKAEESFIVYSNYVLFFPQLVAGPIARASQLLVQFKTSQRVTINGITDASYLIIKGYIFKTVFADAFAGYVDGFWGADNYQSPWIVLQAAYFFAFQIYCDFSGYSLIAQGLARLMGFELVENFRTPFFAIGVKDFWTRWHISFTSWIRDYVFNPMALPALRKSKIHFAGVVVLTFFLSGLWHGPNWTFVIWGGIHGFYLVSETILSRNKLFQNTISKLPNFIKSFLVFHLVCFAWIYFRSASVTEATTILRSIASLILSPITYFKGAETYGKLWAMGASFLIFEWAELKLDFHKRYCNLAWQIQFATIYAGIAIITLFEVINPKAFIYFQF